MYDLLYSLYFVILTRLDIKYVCVCVCVCVCLVQGFCKCNINVFLMLNKGKCLTDVQKNIVMFHIRSIFYTDKSFFSFS